MKLKLLSGCLTAATLMLLASPALAQETRWVFRSSPYDMVSNSPACSIGECSTYTTSQRVEVTLTFAAPPPPNLGFTERSASIQSYTISDGVRTVTGPSATTSINAVQYATNGLGNPIAWYISVARTPGPPYAVVDPLDPNARVTLIHMGPSYTPGANAITYNNMICQDRSTTAQVANPNNCGTAFGDGSTSVASASGPMTLTVQRAAPIPTMSEWAMILLAVLLAGGAALTVHRRQEA